MTEEIQKLTDIEYILTEEVINRKWSIVGGKRRQLLSLSDWTQLPDSNLSPTIRHYWKTWRQKIRNITRSRVNNPDDALELLKTLEKQSPDALNYDDIPELDIRTDELTIDKLNQLIDEKFNLFLPQLVSIKDITNILNEKIEECRNRVPPANKVELFHDLTVAKLQISEKIHEKYNKPFSRVYGDTELVNEAVEFKLKPEDKYPLLEIWASIYHTTLDKVADIAMANKKTWLKKLCDSDQEMLNWLKRIEEATSIDQLKQILDEFISHT